MAITPSCSDDEKQEAVDEVDRDLRARLFRAASRGLKPLPGIELAPRRPGLDVRQLAFTIAMTAAALVAGYALLWAILAQQ